MRAIRAALAAFFILIPKLSHATVFEYLFTGTNDGSSFQSLQRGDEVRFTMFFDDGARVNDERPRAARRRDERIVVEVDPGEHDLGAR